MTKPALYHAGAFQTLLQLTTRSMLFNQHATQPDPVFHVDERRLQHSQQVSMKSPGGQHSAALQALCGIDPVALCAELLLSSSCLPADIFTVSGATASENLCVWHNTGPHPL